MKFMGKIHVTKTYLPPIEEYQTYLEGIWDRAYVTNNGPLLRELEEKLRVYLGVKHLIYCSNGTIVLQLALKVLNITKEVITTPFSYCATVTAPLWQNCTPIFADIDPNTLCLDPKKVEKAITPHTQAILATHVYGIPCDLEALEGIAKKHNLKLIYDAAHAFGVRVGNASLLSFGDLATCSFHATKVFHTIEGGCIVTDNDEIAEQIRLHRSFGHINDDYFLAGINAKNSEFHAAMGLCVLPKLEDIIARRKEICQLYEALLDPKKVVRPHIPTSPDFKYNYAYFPVLFESAAITLQVIAALNKQEIYPRRYFYPSLNKLSYLPASQCPISEDMATRVLCLPLYFELEDADVERIASIINSISNGTS
jgi:dTDP-4-amino-4,6-dideoxygalactose transaminase